MPINFSEISYRLNGFTTPFFGLSWTPKPSSAKKVSLLFTTLEDRRFLYAPFDSEDYRHLIDSVLYTRNELNDFLRESDKNSPLFDSLVNMRAACRSFLNRIRTSEDTAVQLSFNYVLELGQLRVLFGYNIAQLSATYKVDIPDCLESILPPQLQKDDREV